MDDAFIIVGGGSAGCALANRLSADPGNRVLLLEAGRDTPPGRVPDDISDEYPGLASLNPDHIWTGLKARLAAPTGNDPDSVPRVRYEQARVMGGGSSINGQVAVRGAPEDYDRWEEAGAAGWGWSSVLPYFRKLERDLNFDGPLHGRDGPIAISRLLPDRWDGFTSAVAKVLESKGYPLNADMNGGFAEGYSPLPLSFADGRRVSSASGYLDSVVRKRPNLEIRGGAEVRRLLLDGRRVSGVELAAGGDLIRGRTVILCGGAILSPVLLLRSGIGPGAHLQDVGVDVAADLPGVGRNLQDHPAIHLSTYLTPSGRLQPPIRRHNAMYLRYSSGIEGCPPIDMVLNVVAKSAWHALGSRLGTMQVWIGRPNSRGSVTLRRNHGELEPDVRLEMLADWRDCARMMDGVRRMAAILSNGPVSAVALDPFPSRYSERVRKIGAVTVPNKILTGIAALLLDVGGPVRRLMIERVIVDGLSLAALLADERALETHVRKAVTGVWHVAGTCRMGRDTDPLAVTDAHGRVKGVEGLRVADASIMPEVPRANTNLPAIMIGERIADLILKSR